MKYGLIRHKLSRRSLFTNRNDSKAGNIKHANSLPFVSIKQSTENGWDSTTFHQTLHQIIVFHAVTKHIR